MGPYCRLSKTWIYGFEFQPSRSSACSKMDRPGRFEATPNTAVGGVIGRIAVPTLSKRRAAFFSVKIERVRRHIFRTWSVLDCPVMEVSCRVDRRDAGGCFAVSKGGRFAFVCVNKEDCHFCEIGVHKNVFVYCCCLRSLHGGWLEHCGIEAHSPFIRHPFSSFPLCCGPLLCARFEEIATALRRHT